MVPSVESQRGGTCSTVGGEYVGNSGHRTEKQVILGRDVIIFQRKGSDGCACSYVSYFWIIVSIHISSKRSYITV